jgi:hypothetical protein
MLNKDQRKKTRQLLLATYLLSSGGEAKDEDDLREHLPPYDEIYRNSAGEENETTGPGTRSGTDSRRT